MVSRLLLFSFPSVSPAVFSPLYGSACRSPLVCKATSVLCGKHGVGLTPGRAHTRPCTFQITGSRGTPCSVTAAACEASESWPTSIGRTFLPPSCQVRGPATHFCLLRLIRASCDRRSAWAFAPCSQQTPASAWVKMGRWLPEGRDVGSVTSPV